MSRPPRPCGRATLAPLLALLALTCDHAGPSTSVAADVPEVAAFPGAEGGGALAQGGRGGTVVEVTTLDDAGPGSLRACIQARGPRTCVFRVAGTIVLRSSLRVEQPFLTVAGQTAPGGVQLVGPFSTGLADSVANTAGASSLVISTHDVVIRYLRVRHGLVVGDLCGGMGCDPLLCRAGNRQNGACRVVDKPDTISLSPRPGPDGAVERIILDHVSASWSSGKAFGAWNNVAPDKLRSITIQWSLAAESLKGHSTSLIVGSDNPGTGDARTLSDSITDFDWHHDLTMSSSHRHPLMKAKSGRFVNNLVYNWWLYATQIGGGAQVDVIGNVFKAGPMSKQGRVIEAYPAAANRTVASGPLSLHLAGNVGPGHADPDADGWQALTAAVPDENGDETGPLDVALRRSAPLPAPKKPITVSRAGPALEQAVLATVGASRRLDCAGRWVDARDALDRRLVQDYREGTGPRHGEESCTSGGCLPQSEVDTPEGGFPDMPTAEPCPDADHDGMPDAWEVAQGLDPNDPSDASARLPDGTTRLEAYLNGPPASGAVRRAGAQR